MQSVIISESIQINYIWHILRSFLKYIPELPSLSMMSIGILMLIKWVSLNKNYYWVPKFNLWLKDIEYFPILLKPFWEKNDFIP